MQIPKENALHRSGNHLSIRLLFGTEVYSPKMEHKKIVQNSKLPIVGVRQIRTLQCRWMQGANKREVLYETVYYYRHDLISIMKGPCLSELNGRSKTSQWINSGLHYQRNNSKAKSPHCWCHLIGETCITIMINSFSCNRPHPFNR